MVKGIRKNLNVPIPLDLIGERNSSRYRLIIRPANSSGKNGTSEKLPEFGTDQSREFWRNSFREEPTSTEDWGSQTKYNPRASKKPKVSNGFGYSLSSPIRLFRDDEIVDIADRLNLYFYYQSGLQNYDFISKLREKTFQSKPSEKLGKLEELLKTSPKIPRESIASVLLVTLEAALETYQTDSAFNEINPAKSLRRILRDILNKDDLKAHYNNLRVFHLPLERRVLILLINAFKDYGQLENLANFHRKAGKTDSARVYEDLLGLLDDFEESISGDDTKSPSRIVKEYLNFIRRKLLSEDQLIFSILDEFNMHVHDDFSPSYLENLIPFSSYSIEGRFQSDNINPIHRAKLFLWKGVNLANSASFDFNSSSGADSRREIEFIIDHIIKNEPIKMAVSSASLENVQYILSTISALAHIVSKNGGYDFESNAEYQSFPHMNNIHRIFLEYKDRKDYFDKTLV